MKYFALSAVVAFALSITGAQAQENLSPGAVEPTAEHIPGSAELIPGMDEPVVLPAQSRPGAPAVIDPEEPIIKNVAHKRDKKMGKMVNGYYQMDGHRDWGTNARLNAYGYEIYVPQAYTPEDDMPIYPAGVSEDGNESYSTDSWGAETPAAGTDNKKEENTTPGWDW